MEKSRENAKKAQERSQYLKDELLGEKVIIPVIVKDEDDYYDDDNYGDILTHLEREAYNSFLEVLYLGYFKYLGVEKDDIWAEEEDSDFEMKEKIVFSGDNSDVVIWFTSKIKKNCITCEITDVYFNIYDLRKYR
ncbi:hypothetical protein [Clostridium cochlearium]|uniref:hypothetical protein n=1 Tax=Clostridium cochlearium TaxID=1494 RepID=UPI00182E0FDE|nr:hypothetical protein [Clostridium cochlearium]NMA58614.1 hypothetical protein [Clostridium cochlearium]